MPTDERLGESISTWLEQTAPGRLPDRVLEATFERTRGSRQQVGWRARLGRIHVTQSVAALGGIAAVVVVAATLALGSVADRPGVGGPPISDDPRDAFLGTWFSTSDADGGTQTMIARATPDGGVEIVVTDDVASVCSRTPSTMTGTGRLEGDTRLVIPAPVYSCDDGSEPDALSGPPLQEQLRNLTFVRDAQADVLTVGATSVWTREVGAAPSLDPQAWGSMWPQSSLEEVRRAQALADAGDPAYTWQVSRTGWYQPGQNHPIDTEFFARFLEQKLGWEEFVWDEAFAHRDGFVAGDVVYVRCAPGGTNPLYLDDIEGRCAPTIDKLRYETVKINVAQLDRQGEAGVWVVTGWEMIEPAEQVAPPSDAETAAVLEGFFQARIGGEGAEDFVDFAENDPFADERVVREIPLLYATSTGVPYERSEFEIVAGPLWPEGRIQLAVRLFTGNNETVVEQVFSLERDETGRVRLVYDFQPMGPSEPIPATTENGKAVPVEYGFLDGEVTYRAAHPLEPSQEAWHLGPDRTAITGLPFNDDRILPVLLILADPRPIGPSCEVAPAPVDAEGLAEVLRSDPDFEATAPVAVTVGGTSALQIDVLLAPGASSCSWSLPDGSGTSPLLLKDTPISEEQLVRLYLVDLPGGPPARVLAIVIIHADVDGALELAAPILDSIEFHAP